MYPLKSFGRLILQNLKANFNHLTRQQFTFLHLIILSNSMQDALILE